MSSHDSIEDLLLCDPRCRFPLSGLANGTPFRRGLGSWGALLTEAKGRLSHGQWGDWLGRVGLAKRTASTWMKLAGMGLTSSAVIDRGGINAAARGVKPKSASEADLPRRPGRSRS